MLMTTFLSNKLNCIICCDNICWWMKQRDLHVRQTLRMLCYVYMYNNVILM